MFLDHTSFTLALNINHCLCENLMSLYISDDQIQDATRDRCPVILFYPMYRLGLPENYLFLLSQILFIESM